MVFNIFAVLMSRIATRRRLLALPAPRAPTLRALRRLFVPHHMQVRQRVGCHRARGVLGQPAIPRFRKPTHRLHHLEEVLAVGPHLGATAVDPISIRRLLPTTIDAVPPPA